jgi:hypothetical protein
VMQNKWWRNTNQTNQQARTTYIETIIKPPTSILQKMLRWQVANADTGWKKREIFLIIHRVKTETYPSDRLKIETWAIPCPEMCAYRRPEIWASRRPETRNRTRYESKREQTKN